GWRRGGSGAGGRGDMRRSGRGGRASRAGRQTACGDRLGAPAREVSGAGGRALRALSTRRRRPGLGRESRRACVSAAEPASASSRTRSQRLGPRVLQMQDRRTRRELVEWITIEAFVVFVALRLVPYAALDAQFETRSIVLVCVLAVAVVALIMRRAGAWRLL